MSLILLITCFAVCPSVSNTNRIDFSSVELMLEMNPLLRTAMSVK